MIKASPQTNVFLLKTMKLIFLFCTALVNPAFRICVYEFFRIVVLLVNLYLPYLTYALICLLFFFL